jgi:hypothetical protein
MEPEVTGSALLDAAQRALVESVVPQLSGDERYLALMIGNAMRIVAREIAQDELLSKVEAALFECGSATVDALERASDLIFQIRAGRYDADVRLHAALWANAVVRVSISKPSALARTERRLAGLEEEDGPG